MTRLIRRHQGPVLAALTAFCLVMCSAANAMADSVQFDIAAQAMPQALKRFAAQAHVQLLFDYKAVEALKNPAVRGRLEATDALGILLRGTGLTFQQVNDHTIAISRAKPTSDAQTAPSSSSDQEGRSNSSANFLVAQVDQTPPGPDVGDSKKEKKTPPAVVEEIVVTGSRIPTTAKDTAQQVLIFDRATIDQSGQTNVADFLSTLPAASLSVGEGGTQTIFGNTTVQLRGLPQGSTLVLIDGRRTETSGQQRNDNFFDLNNLPLSAVDHIEVVPDGSSAIYGSDAIAGVVNIVMKKNLEGFEADAQYGRASGIDQKDFSASWGHVSDRSAISIVGTYEDRGSLLVSDRQVANQAPGVTFPICNPGNVFALSGNLPGLNAPYAAVPAGFTGTPTISEFSRTAGTLNTCNLLSTYSLIPATQRTGLLFQSHYDIRPDVQVFAQILYSHLLELQSGNENYLFGLPGVPVYTVSAQNPYNPFGTTVAIAETFPGIQTAQNQHENFFRPLVGVRGSAGSWNWELSALASVDWDHLEIPNAFTDAAGLQAGLNSTNPATALNPFVAGLPARASQLDPFFSNGAEITSSHDRSAMFTANGSLFGLPAGDVKLVVGGQYDRQNLSYNYSNDGFDSSTLQGEAARTVYSAFSEVRVPIVGSRPGWGGTSDWAALTAAERYDNYSDFGGINTYQVGAELRPIERLLFRGTHASAFQAPSLFSLYSPQSTTPGIGTDPETGETVQYTSVTGGNPDLRPMTGKSTTYGVVFSSDQLPGLRLSVTGWQVSEENNVLASLDPQYILANQQAFPGRVTRAASCPGMAICPVTTVNATAFNFGSIEVKGVDYSIGYKTTTSIGTFQTDLSATNVYHYMEALILGAPAVNAAGKAQDLNAWAPKWKASLGLGWSNGPCTLSTITRYVSAYEDYESTNRLGGFALFDASFAYTIGPALAPRSRYLKGLSIQVGGVNLFDTLPKASTYEFSSVGYDPAQSDIRGRFIYARLRWSL